MKYEDCLHIKTSFFIEKDKFAKLMADYCWEKKIEFDMNISKKKVKDILKKQLHFQGMRGIDTTIWEGASQEFVQPWEDAYINAKIWFEKNYKINKS